MELIALDTKQTLSFQSDLIHLLKSLTKHEVSVEIQHAEPPAAVPVEERSAG